jgi:hypothetical protein
VKAGAVGGRLDRPGKEGVRGADEIGIGGIGVGAEDCAGAGDRALSNAGGNEHT